MEAMTYLGDCKDIYKDFSGRQVQDRVHIDFVSIVDSEKRYCSSSRKFVCMCMCVCVCVCVCIHPWLPSSIVCPLPFILLNMLDTTVVHLIVY